MNNALQLVSAGGFTREKADLIKRTVAKDATDDELQLFLTAAGKYNLDPLLKEIWFIKYDKSNPAVMTSRDGYLKIAMQDPDYDGLQAFVVREGDEFSIDTQSDSVTHKFGAKRGKILGAWASARHKQRRPQICFVDFEEYAGGKNPIWKSYPSAMIQKVAEVFVLKRQFSISGLMTQEEMSEDQPRSSIDITPGAPSLPTPDQTSEKDEQIKLITEQKLKLVREVADVQLRLGLDGEIVRAECETKFGISDPRKLSLSHLSELRDHFLQMERDHNGTSDVITDEEMEEMPF